MYRDLTKGPIVRGLVLFSLPIMAGSLLQQLYNIVDTLIVGRVLGENALAAVGSAYALMTFLTSISIGLNLGAGTVFSMCRGRGDEVGLRSAIWHAFVLIMALTAALCALVYALLGPILVFLRVPGEVLPGMREYLLIVFAGLIASSVYSFFACLFRALGNSAAPLVFLAAAALLNIGLDLLFVAVLGFGIAGAAWATVIAQTVSGAGLFVYFLIKCRELIPLRDERRFRREVLSDMLRLSTLTCVQQSVMNFGILLVQGLVNSFGPTVMAAFAAAVKIDTFAYLPAQEFGNAYSTFTAQNFGAGSSERIRRGTRQSFLLSLAFCAAASALVFAFAGPLMSLFVGAEETAVIASGVRYLRIEGACYFGIGWLFLLYGYYRATDRAGMSVILTVLSLGTRVVLAYILAATPLGETGIWLSIPIGWALADAVGLVRMRRKRA